MAQRTYPQETQDWYDNLLKAAADDMRTMGLEPGEVEPHVAINDWQSVIGQCCPHGMDLVPFLIRCSTELKGEALASETLYHELTHTLPGCLNHSKTFLSASKVIDEVRGFNNELDQIRYVRRGSFSSRARWVFRFTGGVGSRYGIPSVHGGESVSLYEVVGTTPDGRRQVRELPTGREFEADLVEICVLYYRLSWKRRENPDLHEELEKTLRNGDKNYYQHVRRVVRTFSKAAGERVGVLGDGVGDALSFEMQKPTVEGEPKVKDLLTGDIHVADLVVVDELSYRRRYLAYEAVMRSGLGSVMNINERMLAGAGESRLRGLYRTLDGRLLEAAERSGCDLEPTLQKALTAFTRYAKHRGIVTSQRALDLFFNIPIVMIDCTRHITNANTA